MDEVLNACSAWPPGVSTENPPATQVTWPTTLLLAWMYKKLPLFRILHHHRSTEHRAQESNCQTEGKLGEGKPSQPAFPLSLGV